MIAELVYIAFEIRYEYGNSETYKLSKMSLVQHNLPNTH